MSKSVFFVFLQHIGITNSYSIMGYNGNNRGRTHNWSGVRNKKNYNWGLNLTAKALVAPFYILEALIDLADDLGTTAPAYTSAKPKSAKPSVKPPSKPHRIIESLIEYYPKVSQRITLLSKKKEELISLQKKLQSAKRNIFLLRKRKRIINALNYKILRKEQSISSFNIFEKDEIGEPVNCNQITGHVVVHFFDQALNKQFQMGCALKNKDKSFHEGITIPQSLAFNDVDWRIVFFSKGLFLEDKKQVLFVPYKDIDVKEKWIIHYAGCDTHGYDVVSSSWIFTKRDGGPDLRYSCNRRIHYVKRYQVELSFKEFKKSTSLYFVFQKKEDSANLCKTISSKYDAEKTETIKHNGYKNF